MTRLHSIERFDPITAVLFDFHRTLVDGGDPRAALAAAWAHVGRPGSPLEALGPERYQVLEHQVYHLWGNVHEVDPTSARDLSPQVHREVFGALAAPIADLDPELAQGYYDVMPRIWMAYEDSLPVLTRLRQQGLKLAVVSNVARDVRPVLARNGLLDLFDAVILSYEVAEVKPNPGIFQHALDALGARPGQALMVGDNPFDDGGAAALGIRTLVLPRTEGRNHGLDAVLRLACG
jgi:HAD superfamily hydrolase (TIGR01509 family)